MPSNSLRALAASFAYGPRGSLASMPVFLLGCTVVGYLYQSLVGWPVAVAWIAAQVAALGLCRAAATRVTQRGERVTHIECAVFVASYGTYFATFAAITPFLWQGPNVHGATIACLLLVMGASATLMKARGTWAAWAGLAPLVLFFVVSPLVSRQQAEFPPLAFWLTALLMTTNALKWGKELARADQVAAAALAQAEQRRLEADSATAAKSAFIAMVSHELRTPLNGLTAAAEDLAKHPTNPSLVADRAAIVADASGLMRTLLNDLLDLSKIEAGRMTIEEIDFAPADLLQQVVKLYAGDARNRGLDLHLEMTDLPPIVSGDPTRIRQILNNLLSNAIKFTAQGSVSLEAKVEVEDATTWMLALSVRDTGVGIAAEAMETLFRPFQQSDASITRKYGGTGLGLSIARQLARLMGGDIDAQSTPGAGSIFTVRVIVKAASQLPSKLSAPQMTAQNFEGLRVLAADDHEINRRVLSIQLEALGASLSLAANGEEALNALNQEAFDLVLLDIHMPILSGLDVARAVRDGDGPNRDVPIIATTGADDDQIVRACKAAGMTAHLVKPIDLRQLSAAIGEALATPETDAAEGLASDVRR